MRGTRPSRRRTRPGSRSSSRVEPGELLVDEALELRIEWLGLVRDLGTAPPLVQVHTRNATAIAPTASAASGRSQASRPKPPPGGSASTSSPNSATSAALISCSESPAAIRVRMNDFIRSAMGAFDWSRVVSQTGQTISDSRSAALGGAPAAAPVATSAPRAARTASRITRPRPRSRCVAPRAPPPRSRPRRTRGRHDPHGRSRTSPGSR